MGNALPETNWTPILPSNKKWKRARRRVNDTVQEHILQNTNLPFVEESMERQKARFLTMKLMKQTEDLGIEPVQYRVILEIFSVLHHRTDAFSYKRNTTITVPWDISHDILNNTRRKSRRIIADHVVRQFLDQDTHEEHVDEEKDGTVYPSWRESEGGLDVCSFEYLPLQQFHEKIIRGKLPTAVG